MFIEKTVPIKVSGGWDTIDILFHNYYDIEFTEDFGVFKAGEKFKSVALDYGQGVIEAYNDEGTEVVKKQNFVAKAI